MGESPRRSSSPIIRIISQETRIKVIFAFGQGKVRKFSDDIIVFFLRSLSCDRVFLLRKTERKCDKMKKLTSLLLSLIVLISAVLPLTAFAETKKDALARQVQGILPVRLSF